MGDLATNEKTFVFQSAVAHELISNQAAKKVLTGEVKVSKRCRA